MRKSICIAFLLFVCYPANADDTIRENPFQAGRYDVYTSQGKDAGTIRANPFQEGRYDRYDSNGNHTETIRVNPFESKRYDEDGE